MWEPSESLPHDAGVPKCPPDLRAELRRQGIASGVSKTVAPTEGCVYVDTVLKLRGITSTVFKFVLEEKVRVCARLLWNCAVSCAWCCLGGYDRRNRSE